jgi:hypothetical protein
MINEDLTLFTISDKDNYFSLKKSIESYIKYNNNNVLVVNTQNVKEVNEFSEDLGVTVLNLNKKYGYPMFTSSEIDLFLDSLFEVILRPSLLIKTKYFIWSEPDGFFYNRIKIEEDNFDLISPCFLNTTSKMESGRWVFVDYFYICELTNENRYECMNNLFKEIKLACDELDLDWDTAVSNDLRFNFYPGSIVNTKKFQDLIISNETRVKILIRKIINLIMKHCTKYEKNILFSWDIMLSIVMGIFLFKWIPTKKIHSISNDVIDIKCESDISKFLNNNPDTFFIHPIKTYYKKNNNL